MTGQDGKPSGAASEASRAAIISALRRQGPTTRQRLAAETKLSRSTVSAALRSLTADGSVRESTKEAGGARGRPSVLVHLNASRVDLVGIELGRAHAAVAVADAGDTVVGKASQEIPPATNIRTRVTTALELLNQVAIDHELDLTAVRGVAVGTPGPAHTERHSSNMALARFAHDRADVSALMGAHFGFAVQVDNNTRYVALGEASSGAGAGAAHVAYLRLDEGVGGGVVVDDSLLSGHWGTAGEFGHVGVDIDGPRCSCGGRGCVELTASLPALLSATGTADVNELAELLRTTPDSTALDRAVRASAQALAGTLAVLDVSVVVVGGRVATLPSFLDRLEQSVRDVAPSWCTAELSVRPAHDDQGAGARGALVRARAAVESQSDRNRFQTIG